MSSEVKKLSVVKEIKELAKKHGWSAELLRQAIRDLGFDSSAVADLNTLECLRDCIRVIDLNGHEKWLTVYEDIVNSPPVEWKQGQVQSLVEIKANPYVTIKIAPLVSNEVKTKTNTTRGVKK